MVIKVMRCKQCKQKFEPKYFNQKYCMVNDECIKHFAEQTKLKAWNERKTKLKKEVLTIQDYLKLAQQVFNKYIRLRDKGNNCISCDKEIKGVIHASHYLSAGGHSNVRFNEDNVWISCYKCNVMLSGNQLEYRKRLIKKIGNARVELLEDTSQETVKWDIEEIKYIIKKYKQKIKEHE